MSKTILLVDDSETILLFEQTMLRSMGVRLQTASDGEKALAAVREHRPDLILMDIMMPALDGVETCRRLKNDSETADIPIVIVTTKGEPETMERAFHAGCDDFITKPLDRLELLAKVRTYLG